MRLEIENISLSGNELEFSVKIFRQLWLQNLIFDFQLLQKPDWSFFDFSTFDQFFLARKIWEKLKSKWEDFFDSKFSRTEKGDLRFRLARKIWEKVKSKIKSREIKKTSIWLLQKLKIEIRFWSQSCRKIFTENSSSFPEREIFSISNRIERNNLSICS